MRGVAERLGAFADCGLDVQFEQFARENHISVLPVFISRAVRLFLRSV